MKLLWSVILSQLVIFGLSACSDSEQKKVDEENNARFRRAMQNMDEESKRIRRASDLEKAKFWMELVRRTEEARQTDELQSAVGLEKYPQARRPAMKVVDVLNKIKSMAEFLQNNKNAITEMKVTSFIESQRPLEELDLHAATKIVYAHNFLGRHLFTNVIYSIASLNLSEADIEATGHALDNNLREVARGNLSEEKAFEVELAPIQSDSIKDVFKSALSSAAFKLKPKP